MAKRDGGLGRSAVQTLAYMGVRPNTPPQLELHERIPTTTDSNFKIGTFWAVKDTNLVDILQLWVLLDLNAGVATWEQLFPGGGGGGTVVGLRGDDAAVALPLAGIINVSGGSQAPNLDNNIRTFGGVFANTLEVTLNNALRFPDTTADGLNGIIYLSGLPFMHNFGTRNTFLGSDAGNLTMNPANQDNTGIGANALNSLTNNAQGGNTAVGSSSQVANFNGDWNSSLGVGTLAQLTTGSQNSAFGAFALASTTNVDNNSAFGFAALQNSTADESSAFGSSALGSSITGRNSAFGTDAGGGMTTGDMNCIFGREAGSVVNGDSNCIYGDNAANQLATGDGNIIIGANAGSAYVGAETGNIIFGSPGVVGEDLTIRIGDEGVQNEAFIGGVYLVTPGPTNGVVQIDSTGKLGGTNGLDGQVLIAATGVGSQWANITPGAGISILNGPNSIEITATGSASLIQVAFLAQFTPLQAAQTGNGVVVSLGATQAMTEIFDVGNNLTPGNGAGIAATFTAPATAKFYLEIAVELTNLTAGAADCTTATMNIITTARTYTFEFSPAQAYDAAVNNQGTFAFGQVCDMSLGDTATFTVMCNGAGAAQTIGIGTKTYISGFLISGAGIGTVTLTDNFGGTAMENAGNINVVGDAVNIVSTATAADTLTFTLTGFTNHTIPVGTIGGGLASIPVGLTNQVLLGNTGADPSFGAIPNGALVNDSITFTAGAGIVIAGSPVAVPLGGGVTISATGTGGGTTWNAVPGAAQLMVADNGYYCQNAGLTTLTLPALAAAGTVLEVAGVGAGGWTIHQQAGQNITFLNQATSVGAGGTLTPDNVTSGKSTIKLLCVVANTQWTVLSGNGNFTLA